uniref:Tyrosine-protein kinase ephrin type A/B receptor-like domain-containing protein n=1 Tax=Tetradesmus obliquus TaxID=3088 RepID=A0A383V5V9_TETOB|eukprot:jgi/Sobl393_1/3506/SZX60995.1
MKAAAAVAAAAAATAGCAAGFYLVNNPATCTKCPVGSYCPGGIATKSVIYSCNWASNDTTVGLTTKAERSTSRAACVNKPGYKHVPSTVGKPSAALCGPNTYAPGFNKQKACTPCQSGLKTDPSVGGLQINATVCKVPPGWFYTGTAAVRCPKEYRGGYAVSTAATKCDSCPVGSTTKHSNSTLLTDCKVLKPGRFWLNSNTQMQKPEPTTSICLQNSWCPGAIPPGHYFSAAANTTVKCANGDAANPNGFYQPNWVQYTGVATTCTACGAGILSADLESLNIFRPSDDGSTTWSPAETLLVPMTSDSCYIRRGQGWCWLLAPMSASPSTWPSPATPTTTAQTAPTRAS